MVSDVKLVVEVPDSMAKMLGDDIKNPSTQALFREAVEDKIRELMLFKVADILLKKSKLTEEKALELAQELKERVAKRHGL